MFVKRSTIQRSNDEWLKIIENWKSSKKGLTTWCEENGIPHSSLYSAYKRLFPEPKKEKPTLQRSCFQELKESSQLNSEIEISFKGITLKLNKQYDENLLLKLLRVMEGL
jgi:undecaprenyl pyrophosphate synthase